MLLAKVLLVTTLAYVLYLLLVNHARLWVISFDNKTTCLVVIGSVLLALGSCCCVSPIFTQVESKRINKQLTTIRQAEKQSIEGKPWSYIQMEPLRDGGYQVEKPWTLEATIETLTEQEISFYASWDRGKKRCNFRADAVPHKPNYYQGTYWQVDPKDQGTIELRRVATNSFVGTCTQSGKNGKHWIITVVAHEPEYAK